MMVTILRGISLDHDIEKRGRLSAVQAIVLALRLAVCLVAIYLSVGAFFWFMQGRAVVSCSAVL